ncbi:MAG: aminotransferase class I/II-fold pyridoxal phosphate-dependent enzyme, partial [Planctomycetota bacterium]|nr:aminotransferase class I/II-fold pyridoxal phosphate-dependent enzyme [Planctomycetota bacterium]
MKSERPEDVCTHVGERTAMPTVPHATPLYTSTVYQCADIAQAEGILSGAENGYVYRRDGNPNADLLAEKCRLLHGAERAALAATGMGALSLALLSHCQAGDHLLISNRLYGRSLALFGQEAARLGIRSTAVDTCDLTAVQSAITDRTQLIVVETITNPMLRVSNIRELASIAHQRSALLLVDNTFASPLVCQPLKLGADLVHESLTKIMNGHSDVVLGLLCGSNSLWSRVPGVLSTWGLAASPFDCWMAERGLSTLHLRVRQANENAHCVAEMLCQHAAVASVQYPGLPTHVDHELARQQFGDRFGSVVTFELAAGQSGVQRFIEAGGIPFCPSLGEVDTTMSHPAST